MNEVGIFIYGLVVFAIVSAACWLIAWGIIQERRDREHLDAGPGARMPDSADATRTAADGKTLGAGREGARP